MSTRLVRRAVMVLLSFWMALSPITQFHTTQAQERTPQAAEDLAFTQIVTVGQDGFTEAFGPQGIARRMAFGGTRNGVRTLYLYDDGVFTEVLPADGTLPNGMGTAEAFLAQYRMTPDGDILFLANVSGGSLPAGKYIFRWHNGVITVQEAAGPNFNYMTSDGRWLVEEETGQFPTNTFNYFLTDGTTKEPLISLTGLDTECHTTRFRVQAANANGVVAYTETKAEKSVCSPGFRHLAEWSLRLGGPISQTLLSGSFTAPAGGKRNGVAVDLFGSILNDANQLVTVFETYDGVSGTTTRQVVVAETGGIARVLFPTAAPPEQQVASNLLGLVKYFDAQGRIAAIPQLGSGSGPFALIRGNNLPADVVIKKGDPLFGSTVALLQPSFSAFADGAVVGENRGYYFTYDLADGTKGIGLASKNIPHWANPNGGDWGTADNWTPAAVPGANDEVRFNLSAEYAVNLGTHQVGDVSIQSGDVTFRNGTLTLPNADGQLGVGARNPATVARLTIAGTDTVLTTPAVAVGTTGTGELRIESATLKPPDESEDAIGAILGFTAPATATVTAGGFWLWPEMALGLTHDALLRVEAGAVVGFSADRLFVGGIVLGMALSNQTGRVVVDNTADAGGKLGLGTLLGPIQELVIGESLIGRLEVTNGGRTLAVTTTVGTRDHGTTTDGFLTVEGTNATQPALLQSGGEESGGLFVATGTGTDALVTVSAGGVMSLTQLSLADGAQSDALMFVDGMEAADGGERRSTVIAPLPPSAPDPEEAGQAAAQNPDNGNCVIGRVGWGTLNVSNGALVECRNIAVGLLPGSRGEINIGADGSQVIARGTADGNGLVCVGGVTACGGPGAGARGDVTISQGGLLEGEMVLVGTGGRIRGSGTVLALQGIHLVGGSVSPGITILEPQARMATAHTPGALTIAGSLIVSPTSVITLHVLGGTADLQDRLVVSGTLNLNGDLAINFGNGYAPKQGDRLALIQANTVNGAPQNVVITGLEPGFQHTLDFTGGGVTLIAQNDGVPATQAQDRSIFLPMVQRPSPWK